MKPGDLLNRLNDLPFRSFRIHLTDGTDIEVPVAEMVIVGEDSAVLPTDWKFDDEGKRLAKRWRTVALAHMVQFADPDEPVRGKPKRT